jgi:hypothetical protein
MPFIWIWIYCFATFVIMPGQLYYLLPPGLVGFLVFHVCLGQKAYVIRYSVW